MIISGGTRVVQHTLNGCSHWTGTTHVVLDIFGCVVILQVGIVNHLVHEAGVYFTPAASAAGSGRSSARWNEKLGTSTAFQFVKIFQIEGLHQCTGTA